MLNLSALYRFPSVIITKGNRNRSLSKNGSLCWGKGSFPKSNGGMMDHCSSVIVCLLLIIAVVESEYPPVRALIGSNVTLQWTKVQGIHNQPERNKTIIWFQTKASETKVYMVLHDTGEVEPNRELVPNIGNHQVLVLVKSREDIGLVFNGVTQDDAAKYLLKDDETIELLVYAVSDLGVMVKTQNVTESVKIENANPLNLHTEQTKLPITLNLKKKAPESAKVTSTRIFKNGSRETTDLQCMQTDRKWLNRTCSIQMNLSRGDYDTTELTLDFLVEGTKPIILMVVTTPAVDSVITTGKKVGISVIVFLIAVIAVIIGILYIRKKKKVNAWKEWRDALEEARNFAVNACIPPGSSVQVEDDLKRIVDLEKKLHDKKKEFDQLNHHHHDKQPSKGDIELGESIIEKMKITLNAYRQPIIDAEQLKTLVETRETNPSFDNIARREELLEKKDKVQDGCKVLTDKELAIPGFITETQDAADQQIKELSVEIDQEEHKTAFTNIVTAADDCLKLFKDPSRPQTIMQPDSLEISYRAEDWRSKHANLPEPMNKDDYYNAALRALIAFKSISRSGNLYEVDILPVYLLMRDDVPKSSSNVQVQDDILGRLNELKLGDNPVPKSVLFYVLHWWSILDSERLSATKDVTDAIDIINKKLIAYPGKLEDHFKDLLSKDHPTEKIKKWMKSNILQPWSRDPMFVRALTKAILHKTGSDSVEEKYSQLLKNLYPHKNPLLEKEIIIAVQEFYEKEKDMRKMKDVVKSLIHSYVISTESLEGWARDPRQNNVEDAVDIAGIDARSCELVPEKLTGDSSATEAQALLEEFRQELDKKLNPEDPQNSSDLSEWMCMDKIKQLSRRKGFTHALVTAIVQKAWINDGMDGDILKKYLQLVKDNSSIVWQQKEVFQAIDDMGRKHDYQQGLVDKMCKVLFADVAADVNIWHTYVRWRNSGGDEKDRIKDAFLLNTDLKMHWKKALNELKTILNEDNERIIDYLLKNVPHSWMSTDDEFLQIIAEAIIKEAKYQTDQQFDPRSLEKRSLLLWHCLEHKLTTEVKFINCLEQFLRSKALDLYKVISVLIWCNIISRDSISTWAEEFQEKNAMIYKTRMYHMIPMMNKPV